MRKLAHMAGLIASKGCRNDFGDFKAKGYNSGHRRIYVLPSHTASLVTDGSLHGHTRGAILARQWPLRSSASAGRPCASAEFSHSCSRARPERIGRDTRPPGPGALQAQWPEWTPRTSRKAVWAHPTARSTGHGTDGHETDPGAKQLTLLHHPKLSVHPGRPSVRRDPVRQLLDLSSRRTVDAEGGQGFSRYAVCAGTGIGPYCKTVDADRI